MGLQTSRDYLVKRLRALRRGATGRLAHTTSGEDSDALRQLKPGEGGLVRLTDQPHSKTAVMEQLQKDARAAGVRIRFLDSQPDEVVFVRLGETDDEAATEIAPHIVADSQVHFGAPCVAGTRIPVRDVLELLADRVSIGDVATVYFPDLTEDDVIACVHFAITVLDSEEIHIGAAVS